MIMEIKSKLEARQEALSLAVTMATKRLEITDEEVITLASLFEGYLIGDAELPEQSVDFGKTIKQCIDKIEGAINMRERYDLGLMGHIPPDIQS